MATWHPPIPAERLYSPAALDLGPALAMLIWCYDNINRDGTIEVQLPQVTTDIGKPYGTIKDWWRMLRMGPFFCEQIDRGRRGWVVRMSEDWIDWHVMANNYPSKLDESRDVSLENGQVPVKAASKPSESRDVSLETSAYKVLHHDQNPSSPAQIEASVGGDDDFLQTLIRDHGIGVKRARQIVATGVDPETCYQSIRNRVDPKDGNTLGRVILDLVNAPPKTGKPYPRPPPVGNGQREPNRPIIPDVVPRSRNQNTPEETARKAREALEARNRERTTEQSRR
jgi:hypothetical protein